MDSMWESLLDELGDGPDDYDRIYPSFTEDNSDGRVSPSSCSNYSSSDVENQSFGSRMQKKVTQNLVKPKNPLRRVQQRYAANMRERKRMKSINDAFEGLRDRIPVAKADKKMSKVDTLRSAIEYIQQLSDVLKSCSNSHLGQSAANKQKVIIKCHLPDFPEYDCTTGYQTMTPLYGHSLSWTDEKETKFGPNNTLTAKIWMPHHPRDLEFINND